VSLILAQPHGNDFSVTYIHFSVYNRTCFYALFEAIIHHPRQWRCFVCATCFTTNTGNACLSYQL